MTQASSRVTKPVVLIKTNTKYLDKHSSYHVQPLKRENTLSSAAMYSLYRGLPTEYSLLVAGRLFDTNTSRLSLL